MALPSEKQIPALKVLFAAGCDGSLEKLLALGRDAELGSDVHDALTSVLAERPDWVSHKDLQRLAAMLDLRGYNLITGHEGWSEYSYRGHECAIDCTHVRERATELLRSRKAVPPDR